jgi:acyl carrier protein
MEERLIAIVAATLQVPTSALTLETGPGDLQVWDSLAHLNIVSEIEAEFLVSIPIEQVPEIRHIRDFLGYLE